jgi:hypothetical protein
MSLYRLGMALLLSVLLAGCSSSSGNEDAGPVEDADAATQPDEEEDAYTEEISDAGDPGPADVGSEDAGPGDPGSDAADQDQPQDWLSEEYLMFITSTLAADEEGREEGSPGGIAARQFLIEQLELCGLPPLDPPGYEQEVTTGDGVNLLGKITGSTLPERHVLISAHYDALGMDGNTVYNGAYDNATAVALVVGVACTLVAEPPERSVLVALWDAEESPTFLTDAMGSEFYAANPLVPLDQTDVAVALDLIGDGMWPGYPGHFVLGAETSPQLGEAFQATAIPDGLDVYRLGLHAAEEQPFGHTPFSDYDGFRDRSVPVLMLTDGYTKRYHTPDDDVEFIDRPKLVRQGQFLYNLTVTLANASQTPVWAPEDDYLIDATTAKTVGEIALAPGGMVDSLGLSSNSQSKMEEDLAAVQNVYDRLSAGGQASSDDIQTIRSAVQRMMCLSGSLYAELLCAML